MIYDGMVHILVFGMHWAPKKTAKIDLLNCSKKAKIATISQIQYELIFLHQKLMHMGSLDGELIQTMFSLQ